MPKHFKSNWLPHFQLVSYPQLIYEFLIIVHHESSKIFSLEVQARRYLLLFLSKLY